MVRVRVRVDPNQSDESPSNQSEVSIPDFSHGKTHSHPGTPTERGFVTRSQNDVLPVR